MACRQTRECKGYCCVRRSSAGTGDYEYQRWSGFNFSGVDDLCVSSLIRCRLHQTQWVSQDSGGILSSHQLDGIIHEWRILVDGVGSDVVQCSAVHVHSHRGRGKKRVLEQSQREQREEDKSQSEGSRSGPNFEMICARMRYTADDTTEYVFLRTETAHGTQLSATNPLVSLHQTQHSLIPLDPIVYIGSLSLLDFDDHFLLEVDGDEWRLVILPRCSFGWTG